MMYYLQCPNLMFPNKNLSRQKKSLLSPKSPNIFPKLAVARHHSVLSHQEIILFHWNQTQSTVLGHLVFSPLQSGWNLQFRERHT